MRSIKFRAWYSAAKIMDYFPTAYWEDGSINAAFEISESADRQDLIFMQYTGFKDKNGKEIYEGDILETFLVSDKGKRGEIKFGSYANPWNSDKWTGHVGFYVEWNNQMTRKDLGYWTMPNIDFKIIGDIYENPELLK